MNTLSEEEVLLFHKLMNSLLFYVNRKTGIISNAGTMKEFLGNDLQKTMLLRKKIFSINYNFIGNYVAENPDRLSKNELDIISSWKTYKTGKFFVVKHAKEYSLFFGSDSQKVYGVKGITDSFEEKFEGYAPVMLEITLIPFREHIIYDGLFAPYNLSFGGGMRRSLKQESEEAIQKFGVVTSLDRPIAAKQNDDEEMLRFYMKSFDNKMRYEEEIRELKKKSKELESVYYQEEAREMSRHFKKTLKQNGVRGHFAVLINTIAASGATEKELQDAIAKIIPEDKRPWLHVFKI